MRLVDADEALKQDMSWFADDLEGAKHFLNMLPTVVPAEAMQSQWISVEERLPDKSKGDWTGLFPLDDVDPFEVIVLIKGNGVATTLFYENGEFTDEYGISYDVLYWMPLPEPPECIPSQSLRASSPVGGAKGREEDG